MAENQIATIEQRETAPALSEPVNLMGAIMQAAMSPDVDPDKMERMLAMYERMEDRKSRSEFDQALAQMQAELPEVGKRGEARGSTGNKLYSYAKWEDMNRVLRPYLAKYGFALTFRVEDHQSGIAVTGVLSRKGHSEQTTIVLPTGKATAAMNDMQARGAATAYGKRYTAAALLNLVTSDEADTDALIPQNTIGPEEMQEIDDLLKRTKSDRSAFFAYAKVEGMADITQRQFPGLKKVLERKLKEMENATGQ